MAVHNTAPNGWCKSAGIDAAVHDLPHRSATLEWWYVKAHLETPTKQQYCLFASFFKRRLRAANRSVSKQDGYSIIWALIDLEKQRYLFSSLLDRATPPEGLLQIEEGDGPKDPLLSRAITEVFNKGSVPLPDHMFATEPRCEANRLELHYGANSFHKVEENQYILKLHDEAQGIGCELRIKLQKPIVTHGDQGVVQGFGLVQDMFYCFCPRASASGTLTVNGQSVRVDGSAWYDHEFGDESKPSPKHKGSMAWNWFAGQLDNGCEVTAYDIFDVENGQKSVGKWLVDIAQDGEVTRTSDFTLEGTHGWTSAKTFNTYPTQWTLSAPSAGIELVATAVFDDQEFLTILAPAGLWEGRVNVTGTYKGKRVSGVGFIERTGFDVVNKLKDFLQAVGEQTQLATRAFLPHSMTHAQALRLIGSPKNARYLEGLDVSRYERAAIEPLRYVIDAGGKAWRSYMLLVCCDAVGGNSAPGMKWLAVPELLHTGSLIVDDIEDSSNIRRGQPSAHRIFGVPPAFNAGCGAYFLAGLPIAEADLTPSKRADIYSLFMSALRSAHAGQALDIAGFSDVMAAIVESGDGAWLMTQVRCIHMLKSGIPAGIPAKVGALVGGGATAQIEALGEFGEALGLAFQMMDDVLNIRGFEGNIKERGEDIAAGKVTFPVARAMCSPDRHLRGELWGLLSAKSSDPRLIGHATELLESCGAVEETVSDARTIVESAWTKLDPLIPDSHFKTRLRAFGWFVLERHY